MYQRSLVFVVVAAAVGSSPCVAVYLLNFYPKEMSLITCRRRLLMREVPIMITSRRDDDLCTQKIDSCLATFGARS